MTDQRSASPRSPVQLDDATRRLQMGSATHRVHDPSDCESVYAAYLSLLYAVRGQRRGEQIPLRSADLDALLTIVGEEPEVIEQRLVALMGCTPEEASLLRRALLRHRALTASVGIAAGLSLVALLGPSPASATPPSQPDVSVASLTDSAVPPLDPYATTDDGRHVAPPQEWDDQPPAQKPAPAAKAVAAPEPEPEPGPASVPTAVPASMPALRSPAEPDVVLGTPMAPIDRPEPVVVEPAPEQP